MGGGSYDTEDDEAGPYGLGHPDLCGYDLRNPAAPAPVTPWASADIETLVLYLLDRLDEDD